MAKRAVNAEKFKVGMAGCLIHVKMRGGRPWFIKIRYGGTFHCFGDSLRECGGFIAVHTLPDMSYAAKGDGYPVIEVAWKPFFRPRHADDVQVEAAGVGESPGR